MPNTALVDRWLEQFPALKELAPEHMAEAKAHLIFPILNAGDTAYHEGAECPNYVMCLEGGTRTFKTSSTGRELMIYRVGPGSTCVFTTQCLLAGGTFPAESVAEAPTRLAALPAPSFHALMADSPEFRRFVLDDYSNLLTSMISLVNEVAFWSLDERLARRLLSVAGSDDVATTTHQQLAADLGSVREVISRYLSEWERQGWVRTQRGSITIMDRGALAAYRSKT